MLGKGKVLFHSALFNSNINKSAFANTSRRRTPAICIRRLFYIFICSLWRAKFPTKWRRRQHITSESWKKMERISQLEWCRFKKILMRFLKTYSKVSRFQKKRNSSFKFPNLRKKKVSVVFDNWISIFRLLLACYVLQLSQYTKIRNYYNSFMSLKHDRIYFGGRIQCTCNRSVAWCKR